MSKVKSDTAQMRFLFLEFLQKKRLIKIQTDISADFSVLFGPKVQAMLIFFALWRVMFVTVFHYHHRLKLGTLKLAINSQRCN